MHLIKLQPPSPSFLNYNENLCIVKTKFKKMVLIFYLAPFDEGLGLANIYHMLSTNHYVSHN